MKLNVLLVVSAVYLALVGIGFILAPDAIVFGALGDNPAPMVVSVIRAEGASLLSLAVLSWMARNVQRSKERDAIVVCNIVGYGLVVATGLLGQLAGAPRQAMISVAVHLIFTLAFAVVYFTDRKSATSQA